MDKPRVGRYIFFILELSLFSACCDEAGIGKNIRTLSNRSSPDRNQAILDLAQCGPLAKDAVFPLAGLLSDPNPGIQSSAAYALRKINSPESREILKNAQESRRRALGR